MNKFSFKCPQCQQPLEAPNDMSGEQISCPACDSPIQIPKLNPSSTNQESTYKPKRITVDCPYCGEEILAKAKKCKHCGEFLESNPRKEGNEPFPRKTHTPEEHIWEGHPSGLYYIGYWALGILIIGYSLLSYLFFELFITIFCIGLIPIIYAILDKKTRFYTHTTRKVLSQEGIISRKTHEVANRDIRSINMKQSIIERIFGLGSVQIGSAGTGGVEVEFKGVTNPAKVRDQIRKSKDDI